MSTASGVWGRLRGRFFLKKYGLMIGFLFISVLISVITPSFLTATNLLNILRQSSIIEVMAIGSAFVIIGGGFDISVGSLLALTAALSLKLRASMPWYLAILIVLAAGAAAGLLNGVLTAKLSIVAIITTLGTMTILRGLTYLYTGGYPVIGYSFSLHWLWVSGPDPVPRCHFRGDDRLLAVRA
jgi:ribose transport system permease protein